MSQDTPKDKAVSNGRGSAFPWRDSNDPFNFDRGMTKREVIAMNQLQAWRSAMPTTSPATIATWSIYDADALLEALDAQ